MKEFFAVASLVFGFATFAPYYVAMWRGRARPHIFSWIAWTLTGLVGFYASFSHGGGDGAWLFLLQGICCAIVAVYAIFRGEKHITLLDHIALWGSILAVALYLFSNSVILAVLFAATADCFGFVPTFRKSVTTPWDEPVLTYAFSGTAYAFSLAAVSVYSFETVFYAAVLVSANAALICLLLQRRAALRNRRPSVSSLYHSLSRPYAKPRVTLRNPCR